MRNIVVFCSNPVEGGTAKVFCEIVKGLQNNENVNIIPVVNKDNPVKMYKELSNLVYLDIKSEEQYLGPVSTSNMNIFFRLLRRIIRNFQYFKQIKTNITIMKSFFINNSIDTVFIHNGGYVGDDLCNQILYASYKVDMLHRIMVLHNDFYKSKLAMLYFYLYDKNISRWATRLVTVSRFTKNRIESSSFLSKKLDVVYNGLLLTETESVEKKMSNIKFDASVVNFGMIGNFQVNKGHFHLLKALELVKEKTEKKFCCNILGNVYDYNYFEQCGLFIKNKLPNEVKIFHGINNANEYTELFDFMVTPSLYDESFGLTAVESMMHKTPVIIYATGGLQEVVLEKQDGLVVSVGNIEELADAIVYLLNNPEKCRLYGQQAYTDYKNKFSFDRMLQNYKNILELEK